jgi:hypothetical protein
MSVDVEIYMNNLIKFFKENPKELLNLIPQDKEKDFYTKIKIAASKNEKSGEEITLTNKQLIDICRELNGQSIDIDKKFTDVVVHTRFSTYSLN